MSIKEHLKNLDRILWPFFELKDASMWRVLPIYVRVEKNVTKNRHLKNK